MSFGFFRAAVEGFSEGPHALDLRTELLGHVHARHKTDLQVSSL